MKPWLFLISALLLVNLSNAQMHQGFYFGGSSNKQNYPIVHAADLYSDAKGYGFESIKGLYEVNDNIDIKASQASKNHFVSANSPFYFSVKLPEGNYKVKMVLGDSKGVSNSTIRVECRRLIAESIRTKTGETKEINFVVHIRDSINHLTQLPVKLKPREKSYFHWDNKLTIEFNGAAPKIRALEITEDKKTPTLFLAGNSTVVDQAEEPWASWGQMIPNFFKPGTVAIANYAESGETLKAFENEGRLDKLFSVAKKGDYLFMEFAHNDQKPGANHLDPFTSYQETLIKWICKAKDKGMYPVLVTSTNRRTFDSTGHIYNSLGDYPAAMRAIAKEVNVPLIDLNEMSKIFYEALGPVASTKAFVYFKANAYPNQTKDVKDDTHFNTYGAYQLAKCVAKGIRENIPALAPLLVNSISNYNPAMPDDPDQWHLPEGLFL
jgi:lysophospholipase L1-like esterase